MGQDTRKRIKLWQIGLLAVSPVLIVAAYFLWTMSRLFPAEDHSSTVIQSVESPDGKYVATARNEDSDDFITLRLRSSSRDQKTLPEIVTMDDGSLRDIAWADDKILVIMSTLGTTIDPKPPSWKDVRIAYRQSGKKVGL